MLVASVALDEIGDLPPAAQVEVSDREIGMGADFERSPKRGQQVVVDVVEYPGHGLL
jgi:hypothetical protein